MLPIPCEKCGGKLFKELETLVCINCGHEQPLPSKPKPIDQIDWTRIMNAREVNNAR